MTKNSLRKIAVFSAFLLIPILAGGLIVSNFALAQSCPSETQVGETQATLVGEITDDGGDQNLEVWFQYGKTTSYGSETSHQSKTGLGLFCATVYNLEPATTYHYRAAARNSGGTSYGENKTFFTKSAPVSIDIKANGSDGPITLNYREYITLSWNSQNAVSCTASGDWSGSKAVSGSQSIQLNQVRNYIFTISCTGSTGQTASDSVTVEVLAKPPVVITKPAVVTY